MQSGESQESLKGQGAWERQATEKEGVVDGPAAETLV